MRFLAFEGLDGSGKSTLIQSVRLELEKQGLPFVLTREPGGTPIGDEIRQILLRTEGDTPSPRAEALLYQAGRAHHVESLIRPSLQKGTWVISDRFSASSLAFQSGGREISLADIEWLNHFSTAGLQPDLYVLLDLSVAESLRRMSGRAQDADRFEREKSEFHERVRQAYLKLAAADPARWLVLDASQTPDKLQTQLLTTLRAKKWLA